MPEPLEQFERPPRRATRIDERYWPIAVTILTWASVAAVAVVWLAPFDAPGTWADGWNWLAYLLTATVWLLLLVRRSRPRLRPLQLAAGVSLVLHSLLVVLLVEHHAAPEMALARPFEPSKPMELVWTYDDGFWIPPAPSPVQSQSAQPLPGMRPDDLATDKQDVAALPPELNAPAETPALPEISSVDLPRAEQEQAPHLAQESSALSRAEPRAANPERTTPELPELAPAETAAQQQPSEVELSRQEPAAVAAPESIAEIPRAETLSPTAELARRQTESPLPAAPELPAPDSPLAARPEIALPQVDAPDVPADAPPNDAPAPATESIAKSTSAPAVAPGEQPDPPAPGEVPTPTTALPIRIADRTDVPRIDIAPVEAPIRDRTRVEIAPPTAAPMVPPAAEASLVPEVSPQGPALERRVATDVPPAAPRVAAVPPAETPAEIPRLTARMAPSLPAPEGPPVGAPESTTLPRAATAPSIAPPAAEVANLPRSAPGAAPNTPRPTSPAVEGPTGPRMANLPVRVPAPEGAGGLSREVTPEVGSPSRRARAESDVVHAGTARLLARKTSGLPAIDGRAREPAEAYRRRGGLRGVPGDLGAPPSENTEETIELGLQFLARHQNADGSWSLNFKPEGNAIEEPASFSSDTAATGLALLSFLGAGYDHYGGQFALNVQRAVDSLVKYQKPSGDLYRAQHALSNQSAWLYSHGIASIALCEAYGMTGDPALAVPAQRAIDFIVAAQDPARGAWRYTPGSGSDTSVSGWQIMALKSGELAGLRVPPETYQRVRRWLDGARVLGSQYVYNPYAPNTPTQGHGRLPSQSMTAVGLLMRLYTGLNRGDAQMIQGAEYLLRRLPDEGTVASPARDTYYWYYATQVMFHMRGKYWQAWNSRLRPMLVAGQIKDGPLAGSWDPRRPVPDRWGPHGGRLYVTTLNLLSLEVYYRHLPIYESTAN